MERMRHRFRGSKHKPLPERVKVFIPWEVIDSEDSLVWHEYFLREAPGFRVFFHRWFKPDMERHRRWTKAGRKNVPGNEYYTYYAHWGQEFTKEGVSTQLPMRPTTNDSFDSNQKEEEK